MDHGLKKMRPMQMHRYITENSAVCPSCGGEKKLKSFWTKEDWQIHKVCNLCRKKEYEAYVRKIVLETLSKNGV